MTDDDDTYSISANSDMPNSNICSASFSFSTNWDSLKQFEKKTNH